MTDLELQAVAEGIFKHLTEVSPNPLDGIAIIGVVALQIFSHGSRPGEKIETFANDFAAGLVATWTERVKAHGTLQ